MTPCCALSSQPTFEGGLATHRECHVDDYFMPIYRLYGNSILFVRASTHSEQFEG